MAVVGDTQDPSQQNLSEEFSYAATPWYRDVRILRALAQIVFSVLFITSLLFLTNNLITNLDESNIPLNFDIYAAPFTVAIAEGPSLTTDWEWLQDIQTIETAASLIYIAFGALIAYLLFQNRQGVVKVVQALMDTSRATAKFLRSSLSSSDATSIQQSTPEKKSTGYVHTNVDITQTVLIMFVLLVFIGVFLVFPPTDIPEILNKYLYGGSMARAFVTGIANTLRVVVLGLFASTILGIVAGIGLLSGNFLVRTTAQVYVEIFRNTPLLVQLLFIYRSLTLLLPRPTESIFASDSVGAISTSTDYVFVQPLRALFPVAYERLSEGQELFAFNTRGLYLATPQATDQFAIFGLLSLIGFVLWFLIRRWRLRVQDETGQPARVLTYGLPVLLGFMFVGWILSGGWPISDTGPFTGSYPELQRRQVEGGMLITVAFLALFLGLTLYTGAFIADIVRAGIQSVPFGQIEAARSQGFTGTQVLQLVVLPQALRLIIPPLGNQYVNLGKNSSLGLAVTYVDTYRVAQLANNESGQAVPFFAGLMVIYLVLSLSLSVLTNLVNRTTRVKAR